MVSKLINIDPKIIESAIQEIQNNTDVYINPRIVAEKYNLPVDSFYKILKTKNIEYKIPAFDESVFENLHNEDQAYWVGFLAGDGWISDRKNANSYSIGLELAITDYEHLEKYKKFLNGKRNIAIRTSRMMCSYSFSSFKMGKDLIKLGLTPNKSLTLQFPTETQIPPNLIKHYIRGMFDADGSLSCATHKNFYHVSILGSLDFLTGLCNLLKINSTRIRLSHKDGKIHLLNFLSTEKESFLDFIYQDSTIYLDRKYQRYLEFKEVNTARKITKENRGFSKEIIEFLKIPRTTVKRKIINTENGEIFDSIQEVLNIDKDFSRKHLKNRIKKSKYQYYTGNNDSITD